MTSYRLYRQALLGVLLVLSSTLAQANQQMPEPGRFPGGPGMMPPERMAPMAPPPIAAAISTSLPPLQWPEALAQPLQLSEDQVNRLMDLMLTAEKTIRPIRQTAAKAAEALRSAQFDKGVTPGRIKEAAATAQKVETALVTTQLEAWQQIRNILSAEQLKRLQMILSQPRPPFMEPMPGMPSMPGHPGAMPGMADPGQPDAPVSAPDAPR